MSQSVDQTKNSWSQTGATTQQAAQGSVQNAQNYVDQQTANAQTAAQRAASSVVNGTKNFVADVNAQQQLIMYQAAAAANGALAFQLTLEQQNRISQWQSAQSSLAASLSVQEKAAGSQAALWREQYSSFIYLAPADMTPQQKQLFANYQKSGSMYAAAQRRAYSQLSPDARYTYLIVNRPVVRANLAVWSDFVVTSNLTPKETLQYKAAGDVIAQAKVVAAKPIMQQTLADRTAIANSAASQAKRDSLVQTALSRMTPEDKSTYDTLKKKIAAIDYVSADQSPAVLVSNYIADKNDQQAYRQSVQQMAALQGMAYTPYEDMSDTSSFDQAMTTRMQSELKAVAAMDTQVKASYQSLIAARDVFASDKLKALLARLQNSSVPAALPVSASVSSTQVATQAATQASSQGAVAPAVAPSATLSALVGAPVSSAPVSTPPSGSSTLNSAVSSGAITPVLGAPAAVAVPAAPVATNNTTSSSTTASAATTSAATTSATTTSAPAMSATLSALYATSTPASGN